MHIFYNYKSDNVGQTVSSVLAPYSVGALKTDFLSDIFKFDGDSGYIRMDMGATYAVDSIGIASNVTSAGTIIVKGTSDSSYATYGKEVTLTDIVTSDIIYQTFKEMNYRYYEVSFSDSSLVNIEIGRFALGESIKVNDMRPQPLMTFSTTDINYTSNSGQSYGVRGYIFITVEASWPELSPEEKDLLFAFNNTVQKYKPFFIDFPCLEQVPLYCTLDKGFSFTYLYVDMFTGAFTVTQTF